MGFDSLDVSGLKVSFGSLTALDDVSLTAGPRMVTGIIGPNGAGKTTLLNAICGFVRPQAGSITFEGKDLIKARSHQLAGYGIARTLQFGRPVQRADRRRERDGRGGGAVPRRGLVGAERLAAIRSGRASCARPRWRHWTGSGSRICSERPPATLPHGSRKRVALARALAAQPRLLLLDEWRVAWPKTSSANWVT